MDAYDHEAAREDRTREIIERLCSENVILRMMLEECREYFEGRADAEYFTDSASPVSNEEMRMMVAIDEALARIAHVSPQAQSEKSSIQGGSNVPQE